MKKNRSSNVELLRIISMFLIVMCHLTVHGLHFSDNPLSLHVVIAQIFSSGGKLGVNLFILITGFFMYEKKFKLNRIFNLCSAVWFYSVLFFCISLLYNEQINIFKLIEVVLSPLYVYWFATAYIFLLILSPFINTLIKHLSNEKYFSLLITMFVMFSFLDFIFQINTGYSSLTYFIFLYLTGAYIASIREGKILIKNKSLCSFARKPWVIDMVSILTITMLIISILLLDYISLSISEILKYATYFSGQASPIIYILSIAIFIKFIRMDLASNDYINGISASTFAIYLIHDNKYFRSHLWNEILNINNLWNENIVFFAIKIIYISTIVFVMCLILDKIRIFIVNNFKRWIL